jgi:L-seryl-tRNA(Ser) seleniumtransferase
MKIVYVETRDELEAAISEKTAFLLFINTFNLDGQVQDEDFVAIGKKHGIPTFNDCAADVPPVENLWKYTQMGFDLVAFSGGKGLRGPQSCGLLLGRKDLIAAARLHAPPRGNTVGRGMKVNKEEVLGMLVAIERYLAHDHEKEWAQWEKQVRHISEEAKKVPGVEAEIHVPPIANHVPSLRIYWDQTRIGLRPDDVREALRDGDPSIETVGGKDSVDITTWMMRPGEEKAVGRRLREVLGARG